jgi:hypothetical protein
MVLKAPAKTRLRASRRRAGRRHRTTVRVTPGGRVRDRRLRAGTTYIYSVVAVSRAGVRSPALRVRVHTRA